MNLSLEKRVYFITGGSRGIGKSIVIHLLKEGAFVGTCSRNLNDLEEFHQSLPREYKSHLFIHPCDVRDRASVQSAIDLTVEKFGRLDGVVANAGSGLSGRVLETRVTDYLSQYDMKLTSVLHVVHAALPALRKSDAGRIVIMNAVTADSPDPEMAAVSAARAGIKQLAKLLSQDLAADRICVNTVNIGAIQTGRQIDRFERSGLSLSYLDWEKQEATRRGILFERFGQTEEVSPVVLLLLSPLSSYITGSSISVDGGHYSSQSS